MARLSAALSLALCAGAAAQTIVNTSSLTITGPGGGSSFFGVPYTSTVVDGVATFYVRGDLVIPTSQLIEVRGIRPARILAGGDVLVDVGTSIDVSAAGSTGNAGGGDGGIPGVGGPGGPAMANLSNNIDVGHGGAGGTPNVCIFTNGHDGAQGQAGLRVFANPGLGPSSSSGSGGNYGSLGFGRTQPQSLPRPAPSGVLGGSPGVSGSGGSFGGYGGSGGYTAGGRGGDGAYGVSGDIGGRGFDGQIGGFAYSSGLAPAQGIDLGRDLYAGTGGASGSGGSGGGAGGYGGWGGSGGGGGGGGATSCVSGGQGGNGGIGGGAGGCGPGGRGGTGGIGGGGAGAFELGSLGRLVFRGSGVARGGDASVPSFGSYGSMGTSVQGGDGSGGSGGSAGSGGGGTGGHGGNGGPGGFGGNGGPGGAGFGGGGGTIRISAADLAVQWAVFNAAGGYSVTHQGGAAAVATPGVVSLASNYRSFSQYNLASQEAVLNPAGPRALSPYFAGEHMTPYLTGFATGGAIAGLVANVTASSVIDTSTFAPGTVAVLARVTSVPSVPYISAGNPGVVFVNVSEEAISMPSMWFGSTSDLPVPLRNYGWATDPRFGGGGPEVLTEIPAGGVYVTAWPTTATASTAAMSGDFRGTALSARTTSFNTLLRLALRYNPCRADFNYDGFLTFEDFDAFVTVFEAGGTDADFNTDGFLSFEDFDTFVGVFEAGC